MKAVKAKEIIVPTATLTIIALIVTVLLVLTNGFTKDRIAQLAAQTEDEARMTVLPDADSFEEKTVDVDGQTQTYYEAVNGAGYVFSTSSKGYGGDVVVMTGISAEGEITGVMLTSHDETPGLGAKAENASFTNQYLMAVPEDGFSVVKDNPNGQIDAIAGATITSRAVTNSVNTAIDIYEAVTGGGQ